MGEVVNLRMARKRAQRTRSEQAASERRSAHGISKTERNRLRIETERARSHLDGAQRVDRDPRLDDGR